VRELEALLGEWTLAVGIPDAGRTIDGTWEKSHDEGST
jgi:hypothetical protein